jgi:hypothetical protein
MKQSFSISDDAQGGNGIVAFRYMDLQKATKNFSEKIGGGGFGSVFKGFLTDSTAIAVKRLDGVRQGEKQFRAEVSSIGIIQHINLVKLIGFCSERDRRLLVYEHMPNQSLDAHLFHIHFMVLNWSTRYQIALGVEEVWHTCTRVAGIASYTVILSKRTYSLMHHSYLKLQTLGWQSF